MLKILTFINELFEPVKTPDFNPDTGAELLPGTLLDVTGCQVGQTNNKLFNSFMTDTSSSGWL